MVIFYLLWNLSFQNEIIVDFFCYLLKSEGAQNVTHWNLTRMLK